MDQNISFFTEDFQFQLDNEQHYREWLSQLAKQHKAEIAELNYVFSNDEYILDLNKKHLDHDYYTDILSFPMSQHPIRGDIFISIERVEDNAKTNKVSMQNELQRVMAHGLLHFLGFDDHEENDIAEMRRQEENAIQLFEKQRLIQ